MNLSAADIEALRYVAGKLGVPTAWLEGVINFETAGTWNPAIKNPNSSGRGLIQFLDATARKLGYKDSLDLVQRHPTVQSQLRGPVLKYFQQWTDTPRDAQDFYLRVFLPDLRKAPPDTVIFAKNPDKQAKFRQANPGIVTVGDYVRKLEARFAAAGGRVATAAKIGGGTVLALAILGLFLGRIFKS